MISVKEIPQNTTKDKEMENKKSQKIELVLQILQGNNSSSCMHRSNYYTVPHKSIQMCSLKIKINLKEIMSLVSFVLSPKEERENIENQGRSYQCKNSSSSAEIERPKSQLMEKN